MDNTQLNPDQIQQMIKMLQAMLPATEVQKPEQTIDQEPPITHSIKPKKQQRASSRSSGTSKKNFVERYNKFTDMPEMNMHKEDVEIDKKLFTRPPVPRARKFKFIKAICRVCGKKEDVNPMTLTDSLDRYKCNKCSGAAG